MRVLFVFALAFSAAIGSAAAQQTAPDPSERGASVAQFLTYYYVYKDASTVREELRSLQESGLLEQGEGTVAPASAFLSIVFGENPDSVKAWLADTRFTGRTAEAVERALWLAGRNDELASVFGSVPAYAATSAVPLADLPVRVQSDLDAMWGAFSASGNTRYVEKIVAVLDPSAALSGDRAADERCREEARSSLARGMNEHEVVDRLILHDIETRPPGPWRDELRAVAQRAESGRPAMPNRDGDFSSELIVTDEASLVQFAKPSDQKVTVRERTTAKRGDVVALKILFTGIALTDDLDANVTYDIKVFGPDGSVYDGTDEKDVIALQGKVPMRFSGFDNQNVIAIRFEPRDALGAYKIVALVKDNVGHRQVPLRAAIDLVH